MIAKQIFREYLLRKRQSKGLSLRDVQKLTGISISYLSQVETGTKKTIPAIKTLVKLSELYGIRLRDLIIVAEGGSEALEMLNQIKER